MDKNTGLEYLQYVDEEIKRLQALDAHVKKMFDMAAKEGLYIGLGHNASVDEDKQEGPMVRKLRKLAGK